MDEPVPEQGTGLEACYIEASFVFQMRVTRSRWEKPRARGEKIKERTCRIDRRVLVDRYLKEDYADDILHGGPVSTHSMYYRVQLDTIED